MGEEEDGDGEGLSFWEVSGYKRTTKRITESHQLCNDLMEMMQERGEIEAKTSSMLRSWTKKWSEKIEKGPEYNTAEAAWRQALTAADHEADVHSRVREELTNSVVNEVKRWQKENFHKGMMALHLKEKKEMDDEFKKVQKPWAKKLKYANESKDKYHMLCQKRMSAENTARNQENNPGISEDQRAKLRDEIGRLENQEQVARANYEDALKELNNYNARYMEDMKEVYQRCQEMENRRLEFFKSRLVAAHHALDLSDDITMRQIYADYLTGVDAANPRSDLKWWDTSRGVDMAMNWPQFEEYTPALNRDLVKSNMSFNPMRIKNGGEKSVIMGGSIRRLDEPPAYQMKRSEEITQTPTSVTKTTSSTITISRPMPTTNGEPVSARSMTHSRDSLNRHSNSSSDANPFNEEFPESPGKGDDSIASASSSTKPAVVRALFDYSGEEQDELSFKEGDVFEKLEEKDEQGWCKGKKNGRVGLFPHAYVESV